MAKVEALGAKAIAPSIISYRKHAFGSGAGSVILQQVLSIEKRCFAKADSWTGAAA